MSRDRRNPRQPAGPARSTRRTRGPRSSPTPVDREVALPPAGTGRPSTGPGATRVERPARTSNLGLTRRALIFFAVVAVLALSYVNSLRTYLVQQANIAAAQQQITERSQRVAELERHLQRWNDPAYVKSQARTRLGWVMPGDVGYRVIGPDGKVITGEQEIAALDREGVTDLSPRWWDRLGGSITAADDPAPVRR